ncbi:hypothetical protein GCM10008018_45760 [Paenibacillus marchantiophytorum]|uniref:Uncharacterized protein n=1 Tax=Paenibacillus marchantiophytorum TaxID=1619310 RepID=A0ABQ1F047_9BACL|nr:hypothetical protein GCM10008018_45760 [Paenibacillus marchantiophytorum]
MFVSPQLLTYAAENKPINSSNHISKLKLEGFRCMVSNIKKLNVYCIHNTNMTIKFPELQNHRLPE